MPFKMASIGEFAGLAKFGGSDEAGGFAPVAVWVAAKAGPALPSATTTPVAAALAIKVLRLDRGRKREGIGEEICRAGDLSRLKQSATQSSGSSSAIHRCRP
jgi:hypothetical protein